MTEKPRLKVIAGRPVVIDEPVPETPIERARRRFGKKFSFEPGTEWKPREVPLLTEWMQSRGRT